MSNTTDFGFEQVRVEEKARRVARVFDSVASRYDLMNDLMSLGAHRLWKRFAISLADVRAGQRVLDVAGGTGDLTARLVRRVGPQGSVVLSDINGSMLREGRDRLVNEGVVGNVRYVQGNAEALPFPDNTFDRITIAFGLRNVTHKDRALASMQRILRPGGCLVILEFSKVVLPSLERLYDQYSFAVIPRIGQLVTGDRASYQYLVESIRRHPDQATLGAMMEAAGFGAVNHYNLSGGVVAVHRGYKL
jgi:demethylmenaquinone methyltransferase/2-methoxy-6-polyprenyl-1,4-benzoquinol methylase